MEGSSLSACTAFGNQALGAFEAHLPRKWATVPVKGLGFRACRVKGLGFRVSSS